MVTINTNKKILMLNILLLYNIAVNAVNKGAPWPSD